MKLLHTGDTSPNGGLYLYYEFENALYLVNSGAYKLHFKSLGQVELKININDGAIELCGPTGCTKVYPRKQEKAYVIADFARDMEQLYNDEILKVEEVN